MATNTLKTRVVLCSKTAESWASDETVLLKGEFAVESDTRKIKIGNGTDIFKDLSYANLTPEEVQQLVSASSHSHSNKSVLDATTASFTTALKTKLDGIAEGATKITVDSALSSTSTNPVQNKVVNSALSGKVPTTRTVNGKALSANISLTYSDVGADQSGAANSALSTAKSYSDANLATAKEYADKIKSDIYGGTPSETLDTITEVAAAIEAHQDVTDALNAAIGNKVDKVSGKGLSTNDLTATLKSNYDKAYTHSQAAHAPSTAEKNIIVGVQKNGTDITVDSTTRKVNIVVPTKTSEVTNDSGFITSSATVAKANQLTNARTIDGMTFNGTANIHHFAECSTAAATAAKVVTLSGFSLATGARITVKFTVTNTAASPTLNVNSTGAKAIMYRGSAISAGYLAANRVYEFVYDGTDWELIGDINVDTNTDTKVTNTLGTTTKAYVTGTTSTTTNTGTQIFDTGVYLDTIAGQLVATTFKGNVTGNVSGSSGSCTGNAATATKLATARNIGITGAITGTAASFNGSGNVNITATSVDAAKLTLSSSDTLILDGSF